MSLRNILENIRKRGLKDVTDFNVWKVYSDYKDIEEHGLLLREEDILPYAEQLVYRLHGRCGNCLAAGKCVGYDTEGCSCSMPGKALVPNAKCSEYRWDKMLPAEEWKSYKENKGIQFIVTGQ